MRNGGYIMLKILMKGIGEYKGLAIATPLFIIFVSLCEATARQEKERESA